MIEMHRVIFDPENVFQSRCFGEIYRVSATSTTAVLIIPLLLELKDATQVLKRKIPSGRQTSCKKRFRIATHQ